LALHLLAVSFFFLLLLLLLLLLSLNRSLV